MKDLCFENFPRLKSLLMHENLRQLKKWGVQDHEPFEWLAITAEEFGEIAKAMLEHQYRDGLSKNVVKEAIETATLCLKIAEMFHYSIISEEDD